jgi:hypothetical protein
VRLIDPMKLQLLHRKDVIDRGTLDRMLDELEPGLARRLKWFLLPLVLAAGAMGGLLGLLWIISDDPNFRAGLIKVITGNPGIYLPIFISVVIAPLASARSHRRRVPAIMLKHKRCPHCAYDLQGLPADDTDGATICPECACAWDLEAASPAEGATADLPPAGMRVATMVGIAGAVLLAVVLIAVIVFGPVSRGGTTMVATALMVSSVVAGLGMVVVMLAIWRRTPRL